MRPHELQFLAMPLVALYVVPSRTPYNFPISPNRSNNCNTNTCIHLVTINSLQELIIAYPIVLPTPYRHPFSK